MSAFVQIGEGQLAAVLIIVGMFAGNAAYAWLHQRTFRWDTGSCIDG